MQFRRTDVTINLTCSARRRHHTKLINRLSEFQSKTFFLLILESIFRRCRIQCNANMFNLRIFSMTDEALIMES